LTKQSNTGDGKTQANGNGSGKANTSIIIAAQATIGYDGSTRHASEMNYKLQKQV